MTVSPEELQIREAYKRFYRAKYPDRTPPEADFHYFEQGHKPTLFQRAIGLIFVPLSRPLLLSRNISNDDIAALLANGTGECTKSGWYVLIGHRMRMFVGETHKHAVALFDGLAEELKSKA